MQARQANGIAVSGAATRIASIEDDETRSRRPWAYVQNYLLGAPDLMHGRLGTDMICTDRKQDPARAATRGDPFAGGTAVVTGAASGIGEQLSVQLARRASNLALIGSARTCWPNTTP